MTTSSPTVRSRLAARTKHLEANPISAANAEAARLRRAGVQIANFSIGEPDFETPQHIKEAAIAAINRGETRYTIPDGTPQLKAAVCEKFQRENALSFSSDQVSISAGAKQVIYNALQATLDDGDEVVVPAPYWTSYPEAVLLSGGKPIIVQCSPATGFKMTAEQLARAISRRTKWVIINSPSNPSGAVYTKDELAALATVLMDHPHVLVLSDDIYEHILYESAPFVAITRVEPRLEGRTLVVNGVSKTYAMTGWRIGYGAGPTDLIRAMGNIQAQATSAPCSISQAAAVAALKGPQHEVAPRRDIFLQRRDAIFENLSNIPGISCARPSGAFYLYVDCRQFIGRRTREGATISGDVDLATYLMSAAHVAVVPGAAFGTSPYLRFSYATSLQTIAAGCKRIADALGALS